MRTIPNTVSSLIQYLQEIEEQYKDKEIPIAINLYHDRVLALQSICLDNDDVDNGVQLLFEADLESRAEMSDKIEVYAQHDITCNYLLYCTTDSTCEVFDTIYTAQNYIKDKLHQEYIDELGLNRYIIVPCVEVSEDEDAEIKLWCATDGMFAFSSEFLIDEFYNTDLLEVNASNPIKFKYAN